MEFAARRNEYMEGSDTHEVVAVFGRSYCSVVSGRALQLVLAVDSSGHRSVVLLDLDLPLSLLSTRQEILEVVVFDHLATPSWRVVVLVNQSTPKQRHDGVLYASRTHPRSMNDSHTNGRLGHFLLADAALEVDVRHVSR